MLDKILEILNLVCSSSVTISSNTELIDSNLLDSLALIQLIYELEKMNIELQITQISKEQIRYPYLISRLVENINFNKN